MAKKATASSRNIQLTLGADDEAILDKWRDKQGVVRPPLATSILRLAVAQAEAELRKGKAA